MPLGLLYHMELISEREAEGDKHQNFQTALSVQKAPPSKRLTYGEY